MHLQIERSENWRLISVIEGTIFDVLIDLRPNSETYNEVICLDLDFANRSTVLVPPGVAHGFQALSNCITMYVSSEPYDRSLDKGINIRSLSIKWPLDITHISDRDRCLPMNKNW
jgi:dTDP-4-dehydrorhamnose 3,5-epimerase